jgi:hypothetical protein
MSPGAITAFVTEDRELSFRGIDEVVLNRDAGRLSLVERTGMPVPAPHHLVRQGLVPPIESREFAAPAACLRVLRIAPQVLGENPPEPMELTMFSEQMLSA